jgi:hypothetical protein
MDALSSNALARIAALEALADTMEAFFSALQETEEARLAYYQDLRSMVPALERRLIALRRELEPKVRRPGCQVFGV